MLNIIMVELFITQGTTTEEGIMFVYSLLLAIFNEPISVRMLIVAS